MENFDLTKYLAEGKLNEALAPQDVVDIADTVAEEFTKESADEGDFLIYTVGRMEGESFELDTDVSAQTPDSVDPIGVGEGWGGNFSIRSKGEGYEVRNGEKGGLVAIIDNMGNFRMLSAAESRAEMGMADGEKTDYMERRRETDDYMQESKEEKSPLSPKIEKEFNMIINKLKKAKSEKDLDLVYTDIVLLPNKKLIKILVKKLIDMGLANDEGNDKFSLYYDGDVKETDDYMQETLVAADQDMAEAILNALGGEAAFEAVVRAMSTDDAQVYLGGIMRDYDIEMGPVGDVPGFEGTMDALDALSIREEDEIKETKSNKMKKSELKEMIKAAMLEDARTDAEQEGYKDGFEDAKDDIEAELKKMKVSEADEEVNEAEDVEVEDNENIDVDIEKDIKVDDEESEVDIDVKASMPGESEDVEEVQALLMKAQEAAQAFGDEKLMDQIGNTITYFTRSHVAGNVSEMDDLDVDVNTTEMEAEMGLEEAKDEEVKENLNESVVFPMWNKIK